MKNIILPVFISLLFSTLGCWDEPLLTELGTNRLEVQLKGTYASNSPRAWQAMGGADLMDDSIDDLPYAVVEEFPDNFMLDIAEIRLVDENGHTDRFGGYRKTFNQATTDGDDFFNGTGIVLKNDDPVPGKRYVSVKLYIRKMIFDKARYYEVKHGYPDGVKEYYYETGWMTPTDYDAIPTVDNLAEVIFREDETFGFDFNLLQPNYLWDTLRTEQSETNRIFPLEIPIEGGLVFDNKTEKTVLEIRLVIKNFIKKYEYDVMTYAPAYADDLDAPVIAHYFALSDWLRDIRAGENNIGGNLHAIARSYVPGTTGEITGTTPGAGYVIVIPDTADISNYYIDLDYVDLDGIKSLRDRYVSEATACDPPVLPTEPAASVSAYMDYLLKVEEYRVKWDAFTACEGAVDAEMENFTDAWNNYDGTIADEGVTEDGAARKFTIPPYAVYADVADSFNFTIENVAPGTYNVYYIPFDEDVSTYGRLLEKSDYDSETNPRGSIGGDTTLTIVDSSSTLTIDGWETP